MEARNNQLLRINEVSQLTSLAKSTINLWVALEKFPKPTLLSPTLKVWRMEDIDEWIESHFTPDSNNSDLSK
jgi:predicted DNA-binding transcriptional regulator AlpA